MSLKILAADTALGACSAAVLDGDAVLSHRFVAMERGHAEALAPMVEDAMRDAQLAFRELDRLAVTTGPGTFTGQRVGLAFMRGLRLALKKPLVGITTLDAMAKAAMNATNVSRAAVLHDARRSEVYVLVAGEPDPPVSLRLAAFDDALALIDEATKSTRGAPLAFAGTAGPAAAERYRALGGVPVVTDICAPDASWVARIALQASEPTGAPKPLYLRAPDARLPHNPEALRIRAAGDVDCAVLASLHAENFSDGWSEHSFRSLLATPGTFALLAENSGAACGLILIRVAADEAEILSLGVAPRARRMGTGRRLIIAAAEKAQQLGAAVEFLEVARENGPARALYGSLGFTEAGARPAYYRNSGAAAGDALVLKAKLPLQSLGKGPELD